MSKTVDHSLGALKPFLDEKKAIEIKVNTPGVLYSESTSGKWTRHKVPELDYAWWNRLAGAVAISTGQKFSQKLPMLKAKLPGGHRLFLMMGSNVIDGERSGKGVTAAIRLFRPGDRTLKDFGAPAEIAKVILDGVANRESILVAGGTGSGKTTLTQILCNEIKDEAPIYIEDTEELIARQRVAVQLLVSPITADTEVRYEHVLDALTRMRPDRVIIGELTVDNAFITMRAFNIGVDGVLTTLHANSAADAIPALAELLALKGYAAPHATRFFQGKIGLCIHCARAGSKRVITEVIRPDPDGAKTIWKNPNVDQMEA